MNNRKNDGKKCKNLMKFENILLKIEHRYSKGKGDQ